MLGTFESHTVCGGQRKPLALRQVHIMSQLRYLEPLIDETANSDTAVVQSFRREAELYESSTFKKLMPATLAVVDNADGAEHLGRYVFPPCIVIKKGQSLNEFASSNVADFITIFQALMHVVRAVKVMHDMGYAHRDIKPGNILRRPGKHDWTLIDFGCAVRIGTTHCHCFYSSYI
jgi:serine/threonine protein kinase